MVTEPFPGYFCDKNYTETLVDWLPLKLRQLDLLHLFDQGPFVDFGCGVGTVIAAFQKKYIELLN